MRLSEVTMGTLVQRVDTLEVGLRGYHRGKKVVEVYLVGPEFSGTPSDWNADLLVRTLDLSAMADEMMKLDARDQLVRNYLAATIMQYGELGTVVLSERMLALALTKNLDNKKEGTDTYVSVVDPVDDE